MSYNFSTISSVFCTVALSAAAVLVGTFCLSSHQDYVSKANRFDAFLQADCDISNYFSQVNVCKRYSNRHEVFYPCFAQYLNITYENDQSRLYFSSVYMGNSDYDSWTNSDYVIGTETNCYVPKSMLMSPSYDRSVGGILLALDDGQSSYTSYWALLISCIVLVFVFCFSLGYCIACFICV